MKSIILLSGGLDSLVSLGLTKEKYNVTLALTFDYGQKSAVGEIEAARALCEYYNVEHKVIKLDWLKNITHTALVADIKVPTGNNLDITNSSANAVWVPNRNGLFLNIAASFADADDYDFIVIGSNIEEGQTFTDSTPEFIESINEAFAFSTNKMPRVIAPLITYEKKDTVKFALEHKMPLELVKSCYVSNGKHCGECESCVRLKNALKANNAMSYLSKLF